MTRPGIEPRSHGPMVITLPTRPVVSLMFTFTKKIFMVIKRSLLTIIMSSYKHIDINTLPLLFFYIVIHIIIIIMSCRQHGYPRPSLATSPYHSSPPAGLQGYILCPHIVAVCKIELVVLLLHGHMWGSIGVHHL